MNARFVLGLLICSATAGSAVAADPASISKQEYEVYTALFHLEPPGGIDTPQFFDAVPACRYLAERTYATKLPENWPDRSFGTLAPGLKQDYAEKNAKSWPLAAPVEHLNLLTEADAAARAEKSLFPDCILKLSRVGFSASGDFALLSADITFPPGMRAAYILLMRRDRGNWLLDKVAMSRLLYE